jgi:hypothetical protein
VASLTAGRLSDLDFFNNPVSEQFFQGKGGSRFFMSSLFLSLAKNLAWTP